MNGPSAFMCGTDVSCAVGSSLAQCPPGQHVTGGGWDGEANPPVFATVGFNQPLGGDSWEVIMGNLAGISANFHAVAICVG